MPSRFGSRGLRLPAAWLRRVRSAVVHSRAEHHFDARIRLQTENDRLRQEVALLKEEIRVKDSRMELLAAPRRPY